MPEWRFGIIQPSLLNRHVTGTGERIDMVRMLRQKRFEYFSRLLKLSTRAMGVAPQVIYIFDLWIELRRAIEIRGSRGPFALPIIGIRARVYISRFSGL